jgi:peroxiredoxin Q/BCP
MMNPSRLLSLLTFAAWLAAPTISRAANPADFTVQGANRKETFRLADAKGKYVALHFLLKTECPFCVRHTRDYVEKTKSQPGVVHVFLKPDSEADIAKWANKLGPDPATIFRDPDAKLATAFGIPGGYKFHGQVVHYPALVLLDPAGKEVFRHVGKSNSDRLSFAAFSAKLAELKRK